MWLLHSVFDAVSDLRGFKNLGHVYGAVRNFLYGQSSIHKRDLTVWSLGDKTNYMQIKQITQGEGAEGKDLDPQNPEKLQYLSDEF